MPRLVWGEGEEVGLGPIRRVLGGVPGPHYPLPLFLPIRGMFKEEKYPPPLPPAFHFLELGHLPHKPDRVPATDRSSTLRIRWQADKEALRGTGRKRAVARPLLGIKRMLVNLPFFSLFRN